MLMAYGLPEVEALIAVPKPSNEQYVLVVRWQSQAGLNSGSL